MEQMKFVNIPILADNKENSVKIFENNNIRISFIRNFSFVDNVDKKIFISLSSTGISFSNKNNNKVQIGVLVSKGIASKIDLDTLAYLAYTELKYTYDTNVQTQIPFGNSAPNKDYLDKFDLESEALISTLVELVSLNTNIKSKTIKENMFVDEFFNVILNRDFLEIENKEDKIWSKEGKGLFDLSSRYFGKTLSLRKKEEDKYFYTRLIPIKNRNFIEEIFTKESIIDSDPSYIANVFNKAEDGMRFAAEQKKREAIKLAKENFVNELENGLILYRNKDTGTVISFDGKFLFVEEGQLNVNSVNYQLSKERQKEREKIIQTALVNGFLSDNGTIIKRYFCGGFDDISLLMDNTSRLDFGKYIEDGSGLYRNLESDRNFILEYMMKK